MANRTNTLPEPWAALAAAYGGVRELAEACGLRYYGTISRWAKGKLLPGPVVRAHVNRLARAVGVAEPWPSGR